MLAPRGIADNSFEGRDLCRAPGTQILRIRRTLARALGSSLGQMRSVSREWDAQGVAGDTFYRSSCFHPPGGRPPMRSCGSGLDCEGFKGEGRPTRARTAGRTRRATGRAARTRRGTTAIQAARTTTTMATATARRRTARCAQTARRTALRPRRRGRTRERYFDAGRRGDGSASDDGRQESHGCNGNVLAEGLGGHGHGAHGHRYGEELDPTSFAANRCEPHRRTLARFERGFDLFLKRLRLEMDIEHHGGDRSDVFICVVFRFPGHSGRRRRSTCNFACGPRRGHP